MQQAKVVGPHREQNQVFWNCGKTGKQKPTMPKRRLLVTRAVRAPNLVRKMMEKAKTKVMERTKLARPMLH